MRSSKDKRRGDFLHEKKTEKGSMSGFGSSHCMNSDLGQVEGPPYLHGRSLNWGNTVKVGKGTSREVFATCFVEFQPRRPLEAAYT